MRILLLAPHPFFQERGTPIAVDLLINALAERNYYIDVLTYHEGENRSYQDSVTIHRIPHQRFANNIRPGFSIKKLICDFAMYRKAKLLAKVNEYDCIHAVEESAFMAVRISRKYGIPFIFDMDSSMPQQIADKIALARPFLPLMRKIEDIVISNAAAVVPMCKALADDAKQRGAKYVEVLHDISLLPENYIPQPEYGFRRELNLQGKALLYIGNLESYQGIDLLLDSFALALKTEPHASLVIVGGRKDDIDFYKSKSENLNISDHIHFLGPRPLSHMSDLFNDADILVSPRAQGNNTPMKIYSYLDAKRAILATNLPTHTQIMSENEAELVEPTTDGMAKGMLKLLRDDAYRTKLGEQSKKLAMEHYSLPAFKKIVNIIYEHLGA